MTHAAGTGAGVAALVRRMGRLMALLPLCVWPLRKRIQAENNVTANIQQLLLSKPQAVSWCAGISRASFSQSLRRVMLVWDRLNTDRLVPGGSQHHPPESPPG